MSDGNLTVIVPAYNAERSLGRAVQSAWASGAARVIVVDDGSTDATAALARQLGCDVLSQPNSGAARARRNGVREVDTDFAILLDADDCLMREGVEAALAQFAVSPRVGAVVGGTLRFREGDAPTPFREWLEGVNVATLLSRGYSPAPPAAIVWRADQLSRAYLDSEQDMPPLWPRYAEDYELLLRGAILTQIKTIAQPVCMYTVSGGKSSLAPEKSIGDAERIRLHYAAQLGLSIRPRGRAALRSLVLRRRASELPSSARIRNLALLVRAALLDPGATARKFSRRWNMSRFAPQAKRPEDSSIASATTVE